MHLSDLAQIADAATDPVLIIDLGGQVRHLNPAAAALFGPDAMNRNCDAVLNGKGPGESTICGPDCPVLAMAWKGQSPGAFDIQVSTLTGPRWMTLSVLAVRPPSGAGYSLHLLHDIDTRHKLEEATRRFLEQVGSLTGRELSELLEFSRSPHVTLTAREIEILDLLVQGRSTRAISKQLNLRSATVRNHIQHLLHKLSAHSRIEAVMRAVRERLVNPPSEGGPE